MERSDRALESTGVTHTAVIWRGLSYRRRQHGKLGLASRSAKTGRQHMGRGDRREEVAGREDGDRAVGVGVLDEIEGCHTHK